MSKCSNPRCRETLADGSGRCATCQALFTDVMVRDRYQVERMVGKGGFGITYLVHDHDCFGEARILKELSPNPLNPDASAAAQHQTNDIAERLFKREAKMLLSLQHPGIPKLYAYFSAGAYSYLVQDWIPGKTLSEELHARKQPFSETEVCSVLLELAEILEYLHTHTPPIIHRDIKPQNLMRHADGHILLIDFGAVYQAASIRNTTSQTLIGSPGYAPTEQIFGEPVPQSDLYAAGATMLYLLSGIHPSKLFNHANKRMEWESHIQVSWGLAELLTDLLTVDLSRRLSSAGELKRRLTKLIAEFSKRRTTGPVPLLTSDAITPIDSSQNTTDNPVESPTPLKHPDKIDKTDKVETQPDKAKVANWTAPIQSPESTEAGDSLLEHTAAEQAPDETGSLAQMPYPFLLRRIYRERLSGRLTCVFNNVTKTIYFEEGTVVFAKSSLKSDRLGERLISIRRITLNDFERATALMKARNIKFGAALIKLGCINPEELKPLMSEQFSNITFSIFDWGSGDYQIWREPARKRSIKVSLSTADIIFEGLRRMQNIELVKRWLGDFSWPLTVTSDPFMLYQSVSLNPREAFIVSRIESSMSVDGILSMGGLPEDETLKTLCGLVTIGMLEWVKEGRRQPTTTRPISSLLTNQSSPDDVQAAAAFCYEVEKILSNLDSLNYYGLLGVQNSANDDEIRAAYTQLAKKFHPDRHTQLAKYNLSLRSDLEKIFKRISQVYRILSDPLARKNYDRNVRSTGTYKITEMDDELLERTPSTPPTPPSAGSNQTPIPLSIGSQLQANINQQLKSPAGTKPDGTDREQASPNLSLAQTNFQKGLKYYHAYQFKQACFAFQSAVEKAPNHAEYRIFLARTLAQLQGHYAQAREEFNRAIELAPDNADYFAEVGLFYQRLSMLKQATRMFEKALELVPNHPIARRAMGRL